MHMAPRSKDKHLWDNYRPFPCLCATCVLFVRGEFRCLKPGLGYTAAVYILTLRIYSVYKLCRCQDEILELQQKRNKRPGYEFKFLGNNIPSLQFAGFSMFGVHLKSALVEEFKEH